MKRVLLVLASLLLLSACANRKLRIEDVDPPNTTKKGDGYIFLDFINHKQSNFYIKELGEKRVEIIFEGKKDDIEEVILNFGQEEYKMESLGSIGDIEYFIGIVEEEKGEYFFTLNDGDFTYYFGQKGVYHLEEVEKFYFERTKEEKREKNPLLGKIWYQIYIDTFRNGNRENDPIFNEFGPEYFLAARGSLKNGTPKETLVPLWAERKDNFNLGTFTINSWTNDYNTENLWEKRLEELYPETKSQTKRFGGDIEGIIEKLDYLEELGVEGILITPPFYSYSASKFDTIDFRHISPDFGSFIDQNQSEYLKLLVDKDGINNYGESLEYDTWIESQSDKIFKEFIKRAKEKEFAIVSDINFDYVSNRFFAFDLLMLQGPKSKYLDWFIVDFWKDINIEELDSWNPLVEYRGNSNIAVESINGIRYRRKFVEVEGIYSPNEKAEIIKWNRENLDYNGYKNNKNIVKLNLNNEDVKKYLFNITKKWSKLGLDGFSVVYNGNEDFFVDYRKFIDENLEDFYLFMESPTGFDSENILKDGELDYYLSDILYRYYSKNNEKYLYDNKELSVAINLIKRGIDKNELHFNLLESYDVDRFNSMILNPNRDFDMLNNQDKDEYYGIKPNLVDGTIDKKVDSSTIAQFTLPGAPMIYYGSEKGMWGGDTPHNRKAMLWEEYFPYGMESDSIEKYIKYKGELTEKGVFDEVSKRLKYNVVFDKKREEFVKKLSSFYKENRETLVLGDFDIIDTDKNLVIYKREYNDQIIVVALNNTKDKITFELEVEKGKKYLNYFGGNEVEVIASKVEVVVEAYGATVLKKID